MLSNLRRIALDLLLAGAMTVLALVTAAQTVESGEPAWALAVQAPLTLLAGGWLPGEVTKHWSRRAERLAREAAYAAEQERARLARELHDVVAHHMSVVSMQAGVAERVLDSDPATARTAIATAGSSGREALREMRRLLRLLRAPGPPGPPGPPGANATAPTPGRRRGPDLHRLP